MSDEKQGFGVTSAAMRQRVTFSGWNFDDVWAMDSSVNNGFPYLIHTGSEEKITLKGTGIVIDPYIITTEAELAAMARGEVENSFSGNFRLDNDIVLTSQYWSPIGGNDMDAFSGVFDGNGHTISNVDIAFPAFTYEGLFGTVSGTIQNLNVSGNISDAYTAGILAGYLNSAAVTCCSASGSITGQKDVGGLVGYSCNSEISNAYSRTDVENTSTNEEDGCGGLVGDLYAYTNTSRGQANSLIIECYATGKIKKDTASGLGGIVGFRPMPFS